MDERPALFSRPPLPPPHPGWAVADGGSRGRRRFIVGLVVLVILVFVLLLVLVVVFLGLFLFFQQQRQLVQQRQLQRLRFGLVDTLNQGRSTEQEKGDRSANRVARRLADGGRIGRVASGLFSFIFVADEAMRQGEILLPVRTFLGLHTTMDMRQVWVFQRRSV